MLEMLWSITTAAATLMAVLAYWRAARASYELEILSARFEDSQRDFAKRLRNQISTAVQPPGGERSPLPVTIGGLARMTDQNWEAMGGETDDGSGELDLELFRRTMHTMMANGGFGNAKTFAALKPGPIPMEDVAPSDWPRAHHRSSPSAFLGEDVETAFDGSIHKTGKVY